MCIQGCNRIFITYERVFKLGQELARFLVENLRFREINEKPEYRETQIARSVPLGVRVTFARHATTVVRLAATKTHGKYQYATSHTHYVCMAFSVLCSPHLWVREEPSSRHVEDSTKCSIRNTDHIRTLRKHCRQVGGYKNTWKVSVCKERSS